MNRTYSVSTLLSLVTATLVAVLVTVFAVAADNAWTREQISAGIAASARLSRDIVAVREALRVELGLTDIAIANPAIADAAALAQLRRLHARTVDAMNQVQRGLALLDKTTAPPGLEDDIARGMSVFDRQMFPAVLKALLLPPEQRARQLLGAPRRSGYATVERVDELAAILSRQIAGAGPFMSEMTRISDIAWHIRVDAGGERRRYANLLSRPHIPTQAERDGLIKTRGRTETPWESIENSLQPGAMPSPVRVAIQRVNDEYFGRYALLRAQVLDAMDKGRAPGVTTTQFLEQSTLAVNSLMEVSRTGLAAAEARSMENLVQARRALKAALFQMAICIGLAFLTAFLVLSRVITPLKQITQAITHNEDADIERVLALSGRGDEIGRFARALKSFRKVSDDRRRLELELVQNQVAREAAEAASKVKSEFLANMSHELRTPLNAVIGFSEMMMHGTFGPLSERYVEYAKLINNSGSHLLSLVADILDLAKIEAGRFQADFRELDLKDCVEECIPLIAPKAKQRGITVASDFPRPAVLVEADPRACKQILINLLSNAVKFSEEHGVITVGLKDMGEMVQFSVKDEGVGIPADVLERIGQPFEQATNNPHVAREGTGLGLSLVKALVGEHGGRMDVESREDAGTIVTITLPRRQEHRKVQHAA